MTTRFRASIPAVLLLGCVVAAAGPARAQVEVTQGETRGAQPAPAATPPGAAAKDPEPVPTPSLAEILSAEARSTKVLVDLATGTTTPESLTINIAEGDSIALYITGAPKQGTVDASIATEIMVTGAALSQSVPGPRVLVSFFDCESKYAARFVSAATSNQHKQLGLALPLKSGENPCPGGIALSGTASAIVFAESPKDRAMAFLRVTAGDRTAAIAVRLVRRSLRLAFSTGFAAFGVRDERYVLGPATTAGHVPVQRTSDGEIPYSIATFAHYDRISKVPFAISLGVAAKVPVEDVTLLLGLSVKARTLPLGQSGYFTLGGALTRRARLANGFEKAFKDGGTIPATTDPKTLTERSRDWSFFAAFTFAFAGGGESDFSKRVSGQ